MVQNFISKTMSRAEKSELRALGQKKYRYRYQRFLVEGIKLLAEALKAGFPLESIYVASERFESITKQLDKGFESGRSNLYRVPYSDIQQITHLKHPEGLCATARIPQQGLRTPALGAPPAIYLWEVNDPGNLGTILRTALWFNVKQVILSPNAVDPFSPKVVRASMGAIFRINLRREIAFEALLATARQTGFSLTAIDLEGLDITQARLNPEAILCFGSETHGLPDFIKQKVDNIITIPKLGQGDSLNLGVSAGIVLKEIMT